MNKAMNKETRRLDEEPVIQWESFDENAEPVLEQEGSMGEEAGESESEQQAEPAEMRHVQRAEFVPMTEDPGLSREGINLLRDIEVELTAELGSTRMLIKHILGLRPGSLVELNRLAGEPVDITINSTLIARGEVVVVDEKFAVRVVEIVPPERRLGST